MKFISVLILVSMVNATPDGAPPSCCTTMIPNHGVDAQTTFSPFVTTPVKVNIRALKKRINTKCHSNNIDLFYRQRLPIMKHCNCNWCRPIRGCPLKVIYIFFNDYNQLKQYLIVNKIIIGYLLVAHMRGMDHNVGTFKVPSDGKVIDCENASPAVGFYSFVFDW